MVDPRTTRRWGFRMLFAGLAALILLVGILPVGIGRGGVPAPDTLILLTFAWVLRRPDFVPVWLVAGALLAADILFMRPLGLWTALVVAGSEFLRLRASRTASEITFPVEWTMVACVLAAMTLAETVVLAATMVPRPAIGVTGLQLLVEAALYPLVAAATLYLFGVQPMAPGERHRARTGT